MSENTFMSQSALIGDAATNVEKPLENLLDMIELHRTELQDTGTRLAKVAHNINLLASTVKVVVIFLGALVASKEVANQLMGSSNVANIVIFTLIGLLITVLTGLEVAFKWESTSAELKNLVAMSRAATRKAATDVIEVLATSSDTQKPVEIKRVLDALDATVVEIQTRAAKLGVDAVAYRKQKQN